MITIGALPHSANHCHSSALLGILYYLSQSPNKNPYSGFDINAEYIDLPLNSYMLVHIYFINIWDITHFNRSDSRKIAQPLRHCAAPEKI
ncbi:hypothetical protein ACT691_02000 [Vibrio metschnikovii]